MSGKPKRAKRERLDLRVDAETKRELFSIARKVGRPASDIIREAVAVYAPGIEHAAKNKKT